MTINKEKVLEMFDFLHDVITDMADESEEWFKVFNEAYDEIREGI